MDRKEKIKYGVVALLALSVVVYFWGPLSINFIGFYVVGVWFSRVFFLTLKRVVNWLREKYFESDKKKKIHYGVSALTFLGLVSLLFGHEMVWFFIGLVVWLGLVWLLGTVLERAWVWLAKKIKGRETYDG